MGISVIMSVYNSDSPEFFDRALQSIWTDQTCPPQQVVLIVDGSLGDNLYQVVDKWKGIMGPALEVHCNGQNLGLTKSLNTALEFVTQEYIARMDADDISLPDRFRLQKEFLDAHPEEMVLGGSLQEFNAENDCLNVRHYPANTAECIKYIHKASPLAHPTVMMRRKMFDDGMRYNDKYRTTQDLALWFDVLKAGYNIANIDDIILKFRRDDNVYKRRSRKKAFVEFRIYMNGIHRLFGLFTPKYVYPCARLVFRLMPVSVIKKIYNGNMRKKMLEKNQ